LAAADFNWRRADRGFMETSHVSCVPEGVIDMSTSIEERVAILEKELTNLKSIIQRTSVEKDWRKTFGMSANDPGFDEMIRLGWEIRQRDKEDNS
jgi:hypothetical protein